MTVEERTQVQAQGPLLSVAFCPGAPLLLPAVAGRSHDDIDALRSACAGAVGAMLSTGPEVVVVVGAAPGVPSGVRFGPGDVGSLRGFGVPLDVPLGGHADRAGASRLPPAHTIGAWLLADAGCTAHRAGVAPEDLADALAALPGPAGLLVVGDGSARRTVKAPGYLDPAAGPFDSIVAAALATGDAAALAGLDAQEGERLLADGVPAWRAVGRVLAGRPVRATLRYDDAPFGVGYLVADWTLR